jgi:predicted unusual protein kinase regulating ubiquinone biosynthesis (AarF/ABC1/UbiB family)
MTDQRIPSGRLARFGRLALLGARTGASLLASKDGSSAAARAAVVLGNLRGLAAKVGQMASYVDGIVPEAHRAAYEKSLTALRAQAPTSSFASVRDTVETDLGAPLDKLFSSFEEVPFASASIGQVHRATLVDGRAVAVKVQHEGIALAVEADLENAGVLESLARMGGGGKLNSRGILEEIKKRFREELDYSLEAERQNAFIALHRGDPTIRIPNVIADRSSGRVLTSDLAAGISLEEAALRSEPARAADAETLWRFVFKGNLVLGMFNADPHPGNYLFGEDGVVTFLDFGCCEPIVGERLTNARNLHRAALGKDEGLFAKSVTRVLKTEPGPFEDFAVAYSRRCFEPLFGSPYRITRDYAAGLVTALGDMKKVAFSKGWNFTPLPEGMLFMNRLQFGFYSVLARLDVEVDYARVETAFLDEAGML